MSRSSYISRIPGTFAVSMGHANTGSSGVSLHDFSGKSRVQFCWKNTKVFPVYPFLSLSAISNYSVLSVLQNDMFENAVVAFRHDSSETLNGDPDLIFFVCERLC